jgi:hypothetical protein
MEHFPARHKLIPFSSCKTLYAKFLCLSQHQRGMCFQSGRHNSSATAPEIDACFTADSQRELSGVFECTAFVKGRRRGCSSGAEYLRSTQAHSLNLGEIEGSVGRQAQLSFQDLMSSIDRDFFSIASLTRGRFPSFRV